MVKAATVPIQAFDMLRDSYARHNIVWHIDDGRLGGGEFIPFKDILNDNDLDLWYWKYFMHGDAQNWRRGVFRWCIVAYNYYLGRRFHISDQESIIRLPLMLSLSQQNIMTCEQKSFLSLMDVTDERSTEK